MVPVGSCKRKLQYARVWPARINYRLLTKTQRRGFQLHILRHKMESARNGETRTMGRNVKHFVTRHTPVLGVLTVLLLIPGGVAQVRRMADGKARNRLDDLARQPKNRLEPSLAFREIYEPER